MDQQSFIYHELTSTSQNWDRALNVNVSCYARWDTFALMVCKSAP